MGCLRRLLTLLFLFLIPITVNAQGLNFDGPVYGTALSTGWLSGGEITINSGDASKFDLAAGSGLIVDATDPNFPTYRIVNWPASTGVPVENIATNTASFVAIDENGDLIQSITFPSGGNLREYVQLGGFTHADNTVIDTVSDFTSATPYQNAPDLTDLIVAIGVVNLSGNIIYSSNANLKFNKTAGSSFYFGIESKADPVDPNNISLPALDEPNVVFVWSDGAGGFNSKLTDTMITGRYDDGTGGATQPNGVLPGGQWTNLRIKHSPDLNQLFFEFGDGTHSTSSTAVNNITIDTYTEDPSLAGVPIRAYISLRSAAADLSDSGDAIFTQCDKFGVC